MGWFDKTLIGSIVTPFPKKVKIFLKEYYKYDLSPLMEPVLVAFSEQQQQMGNNHEFTGLLFMAVLINSIEETDTETEKFVYEINLQTINTLPFITQKETRFQSWKDIAETHAEAAKKHLPEWVIEEIYSSDIDSMLKLVFSQIKEKDMAKLNEYFGF